MQLNITSQMSKAVKMATSTQHSLQVLSLGGELLSQAENLLRAGLHTSEVADGYLKAGEKVAYCLEHFAISVAAEILGPQ